MEDSSLIFICGAVRSGSTLFHLMLDAHPEISNPGEFDFLFDQLSDDGNYPDIEEYIDYLLGDRIFKSKELDINKALGFRELIQFFVDQKSRGCKFLVLNIHRHYARAYHLFPNAKYIHLIRDPRDVARSCIGMNWAGNVYYGVDNWLETERDWDKLNDLLNNRQYIEVRFEKLISDTECIIKYVCEFIGVSYTEAIFNYQHSSSYKKPDITLVNQWERKLSAREIQHIESKVMLMMVKRQYKKSGYPLITLGNIENLKLSVQNKYFKIINGIKKYGLFLYLLYRITGRVGTTSLHKRLQRKISNIDMQDLK